MKLSKYITFQNHHEGTCLPNSSISLGLVYYYDEPNKYSGFYLKFILPKIKEKSIISDSTFDYVTCPCKHHFLFRVRRSQYSSKLKFNFYDGWFEI